MGMLKNLVFSILLGAGLGAGMAAVEPGVSFFAGWLAAGVLSTLSIFVLVSAWRRAGGRRLLAWMMALAFLLRLGGGVFLSRALPAWGYDEPTQSAGYLFYDADRRDNQAWELAQSDAALWQSFGEEFKTDQYGGLLSLSAAVYRTLSPDYHRASLILILGAACFTLGVPFFWLAVRGRFKERTASMAGWILVLYPDAVFYSCSQMREPFLIGLLCIAMWAVMVFPQRGWKALGVLAASLAGMAVFSSRIAAVAAGALAVWFWLEHLLPRFKRLKWLGWTALVVILAGGAVLSWGWLRSSSEWDMLVTERGSGRVQLALEELGEEFRIPFIIGYGAAQPVLPAAIAEPSIPLWKVIGIWRAAGWYGLAPLLLYACVAVWRARPASDRRILLWLAGFVLAWILIASARAGGDQWDNPRYRINFMPWLALLAGWALDYALSRRDAWLPRLVLVEVIFLAVFTNWYFSRYFHLGGRLSFPRMVMLIAALGAVVVAGGLAWDWVRKRRARR